MAADAEKDATSAADARKDATSAANAGKDDAESMLLRSQMPERMLVGEGNTNLSPLRLLVPQKMLYRTDNTKTKYSAGDAGMDTALLVRKMLTFVEISFSF